MRSWEPGGRQRKRGRVKGRQHRPASPIATGCQGNPCSTGIRWGVSPAAQTGRLNARTGWPAGAEVMDDVSSVHG